MASKVVVLLLLGLTSSTGSGDSEVIERTKDFAPNQIVCSSNTTTNSPLNVTAIVNFIFKDNVECYQSVLNMVRNARTLEMKNAIIKEVAVDLESSKVDPDVILDFYNQIKYMKDISSKEIYQAFVNRSASILAESIHSNKSSIEFPVAYKLLIRLDNVPDYYMEDILKALFDIVLSSESPLKVAHRFYNLNTSFHQITLANLLLLNRTEVKTNSSEHAGLQDNLQRLAADRSFEDVPVSLRRKVIRMFPHFFDWFSSTLFVCLRHAYNNSITLGQCRYRDTLTLCTKKIFDFRFTIGYDFDQKRSGITLSNLISAGYFATDPAIQVQRTREKVSRTIYNDGESFWWRVVPVPNSGVALYDYETSRSVLCANYTMPLFEYQNHAYTRPAEDFEAHREECIWFFDDCRHTY